MVLMISPRMPRSRRLRSASRPTIHLPGPAAVARPMRSSLYSLPMASRRIAGARTVRPQVDEAGLVRRHPDRNIEARPALGFHLPLQCRTDLMFRLRPEFGRDQFLGARPQAVADVVTGDDEIRAIRRDAPHQQVDMGIVGVPV